MDASFENIESPKPKQHLPQLPWGLLPDKYRLGKNFNDIITLYRGDLISNLRKNGLHPNASESEVFQFMDQIDEELRKGSSADLGRIINPHITYAHKKGVHTPFISAAMSEVFAKRFIRENTEPSGIATLKVPVNRLIAFRDNESNDPLEVLIFAGVSEDEIEKIESVSK